MEVVKNKSSRAEFSKIHSGLDLVKFFTVIFIKVYKNVFKMYKTI